MFEDLLTCPFCATAPTMRETLEHYAADAKHPAGSFTAEYSVTCDECGAHQSAEYRDDAIAAWNRRAPAPDPVKAEGERVSRPLLDTSDLADLATVDHPDAYLNALLTYTRDLYGDMVQSGRKPREIADVMQHIERAARGLHAKALAVALPEPAGEPVAWTHSVQLSMLERSPRQAAAMWGEPNGQISTPLFAHPAPVKADTAAEGLDLLPAASYLLKDAVRGSWGFTHNGRQARLVAYYVDEDTGLAAPPPTEGGV